MIKRRQVGTTFRSYSAPRIHPSYSTQLPRSLINNPTLNIKMGTISIRKFIRWLPDEPTEPTTTLVITSPRLKRFVDLRILLSENNSTDKDGKTLHLILMEL
jgi:hypothetical protein